MPLGGGLQVGCEPRVGTGSAAMRRLSQTELGSGGRQGECKLLRRQHMWRTDPSGPNMNLYFITSINKILTNFLLILCLTTLHEKTSCILILIV